MPWPDYATSKKKGTWDESKVMEAKDVRDQANTKPGQTAHFARIAELLYMKGGELPEGHPDRKLKARDVFLGDNVRDEYFNYAIFDEVGSSPSSIEAGRAVDAFSVFPGYTQEQSDAVSAYTQSFLKGIMTWVSLPRERWPASWKGMHNPVCPLVLNLYGHPQAGNNCGEDCDWQAIPVIPN